MSSPVPAAGSAQQSENASRLAVFLSHSSADKALARRLARDLQASQVEVWLDQWQIGVGDAFEQCIARGLADADFVIVLLTRHAVASEWVNREWRQMIEREARSRRMAVLPVRAEVCELPDFLAQRSHADISAGSYVPGFRQLLHLLSQHGDAAGIVLAEAASAAEAARRQAHLLQVEQTLLGLPHPAAALQRLLPLVTPIALELARDLAPWVEPDAHGASRLMDPLLPSMLELLRRRYGFRFPGVRVALSDGQLPGGTAVVLIDEIPERTARFDLTLPVAEQQDVAEALCGLLFDTLCGTPQAFLHLDEVHRLASLLPAATVQRAVPRVVSWIVLTRILQALLEEQVGIAPLHAVLEALGACDPERATFNDCVEAVRQALAPQIAEHFLSGRQSLPVLVAHEHAEARLRRTLHLDDPDAVPAADPQGLLDLLATVRDAMQALGDGIDAPVLLVADSRIRAGLRRLVKQEFPELHVLSRQELPAGLPLHTVGLFGEEAAG